MARKSIAGGGVIVAVAGLHKAAGVWRDHAAEQEHAVRHEVDDAEAHLRPGGGLLSAAVGLVGAPAPLAPAWLTGHDAAWQQQRAGLLDADRGAARALVGTARSYDRADSATAAMLYAVRPPTGARPGDPVGEPGPGTPTAPATTNADADPVPDGAGAPAMTTSPQQLDAAVALWAVRVRRCAAAVTDADQDSVLAQGWSGQDADAYERWVHEHRARWRGLLADAEEIQRALAELAGAAARGVSPGGTPTLAPAGLDGHARTPIAPRDAPPVSLDTGSAATPDSPGTAPATFTAPVAPAAVADPPRNTGALWTGLSTQKYPGDPAPAPASAPATTSPGPGTGVPAAGSAAGVVTTAAEPGPDGQDRAGGRGRDVLPDTERAAPAVVINEGAAGNTGGADTATAAALTAEAGATAASFSAASAALNYRDHPHMITSEITTMPDPGPTTSPIVKPDQPRYATPEPPSTPPATPSPTPALPPAQPPSSPTPSPPQPPQVSAPSLAAPPGVPNASWAGSANAAAADELSSIAARAHADTEWASPRPGYRPPLYRPITGSLDPADPGPNGHPGNGSGRHPGRTDLGPALRPAAIPLALGAPDDLSTTIDLATTEGLGLTGPGAPQIARTVLARLLTGHRADSVVVTSPDVVQQLLGAPAPPLIALHLADDPLAGLDLLEDEITHRRRHPSARPWILFVFAPRDDDNAQDLHRLLADAREHTASAVLLGPWPHGTTLTITGDHHVSHCDSSTPSPVQLPHDRTPHHDRPHDGPHYDGPHYENPRYENPRYDGPHGGLERLALTGPVPAAELPGRQLTPTDVPALRARLDDRSASETWRSSAGATADPGPVPADALSGEHPQSPTPTGPPGPGALQNLPAADPGAHTATTSTTSAPDPDTDTDTDTETAPQQSGPAVTPSDDQAPGHANDDLQNAGAQDDEPQDDEPQDDEPRDDEPRGDEPRDAELLDAETERTGHADVDAAPSCRPLVLCVVGPVSLHVRDDPADPTRLRRIPISARSGELLAYLACQVGGAAPRDTIVEALWPDSQAAKPESSLAQAIRQLRRTLRIHTPTVHLPDHDPGADPDTSTNTSEDTGAGADATGAGIAVDSGTLIVHEPEVLYRLNDDLVDVDLWALTVAARRVSETASSPDLTAADTVLQLYRGPYAADHHSPWLTKPRRDTLVRYLASISALTHHLAVTDPDRVIGLLTEAREHEPTNERIYRSLMRLHHQHGRHNAALDIHDLLLSSLAEIDTKPSADTVALATTIRRAQAAL